MLNTPVKEFKSPTIKQLEEGAKFIYQITNNKNNNNKVYIHCREGVSRAPCFLIAYYIKFHKLTFEKALFKIKRKRQFVNILPEQKKRLLLYEKFNKKNL